ncbi:unnamed protein product [Schistocephalus solidus]|uniref:Secreted protein n=1 Tax=Schistocephalus solidus TaxID=70667 RepID=A0A183SP93_SCHSO|nr:unnamed protein product [Schistocephalus solidus]
MSNLLVLILVTAAIMPDLAGLDDVTNCASRGVTTRGSRPEQLNQFFVNDEGRIWKAQKQLPRLEELCRVRPCLVISDQLRLLMLVMHSCCKAYKENDPLLLVAMVEFKDARQYRTTYLVRPQSCLTQPASVVPQTGPLHVRRSAAAALDGSTHCPHQRRRLNIEGSKITTMS